MKKWRQAGVDRGFMFLMYNLTVAYPRTNLLDCYVGKMYKFTKFASLLGKIKSKLLLNLRENWNEVESS